MARKIFNDNLVEKFPPKKGFEANGMGPPFWLSTSNYYILTVAITIAIFFVVWGGLNNMEEETPWIPAGISASFILIFAVVLRELILRKAYQKSYLAQKRLDYNLKTIYQKNQLKEKSDKLTLEKNQEIIREIETKSKAARVLARHPEVHFEVVELCSAYLEKNERELEVVNIGSPRIVALRRGHQKVKILHKYHFLNWASIESQNYVKESKISATVGEKLENAQRALNVLETALQYYSDEPQLLESAEAVNEFIISIKVSHWIEQAERAAFKENYNRAINHYRDALFFLARENERSVEHELIAQKINLEIEKLREISN